MIQILIPKINVMKTEQILISNLKCGGCANTVRKSLSKIEGVARVEVDVEQSLVTVNAEETTERSVLVEKLRENGYPEAGTTNSTLTKAKSYVSCMVGRIQ